MNPANDKLLVMTDWRLTTLNLSYACRYLYTLGVSNDMSEQAMVITSLLPGKEGALNAPFSFDSERCNFLWQLYCLLTPSSIVSSLPASSCHR